MEEKQKFITYGFKYDPELFREAKGNYERSFLNKPEGGLWCSPVDSWFGWKDWCEGENYRPESFGVSFTFELDEKTRILKIDSLNDLKAVAEEYGKYLFLLGWRDRVLDFDKIIKDYDAMWLTARGNRECHLPLDSDIDLNAWDCESLIIFRKEVIKNITAGS